MRGQLDGWLLGLMLCMMCTSVAAGTITTESRSIPGLTARTPIVTHLLRFTGRIEEGDADRLRGILEQVRRNAPQRGDEPLAMIELSSLGGDLLEGLKLGYMLREFEVGTIVRKADICLSACALFFLGGTANRLPPRALPSRTIEIGGQVGFHSFYTDPALIERETDGNAVAGIVRGFGLARAGASALIRFGADMEIDPGFIAGLLAKSREEWLYVATDQEFLSVRACPSGSEPRLGRPEQQAVNVCNHATGWFSVATPDQVSSMSATQARRQLLEHVHRNIESFNVKGPMVAQLGAVLLSRDDRLVESVYNDLRAGGLPLPRTFTRNMQVQGFSSGALQLHCHVTLDLGDPDKFDLVLAGPTGLLPPFRPPPRACPRLFRYDRNEMINPPRARG
ncbi:MAG: hypothetical protein ACOY4R_20985 [Pseudomonadota bacterium]